MAGTTPVTLFKGYIGADGEFHLPISTDEFTPHHNTWALSFLNLLLLQHGVCGLAESLKQNKTRDYTPILLLNNHESPFSAHGVPDCPPSAHSVKGRHRQHWVPLAFPWYKVNVDAAIFSQLRMIGVGVVIRDHEGMVIVALSKRLPIPLGPLDTEAKAMDEATLFAWDMGVRDDIFETDSSTVFHALEDPAAAQTSIANLVSGIHIRLQEFRSFKCS